MSLHRGLDGSAPRDREPAAGAPGWHEERREARSTRIASGTLACPACDAPVAAPARPAAVTEPLGCPYCARAGAIREFLTLGEPTRPTRVAVQVRTPAARPRRPARSP